jgi:dTMP kinase
MPQGRDVALFITFEGVEGSGKTTQIRRLKTYLARKGISCRVTREPGGTSIGDQVRKILLNPDNKGLDPIAELFLYEAARAQHIKEFIQPLLEKKGVILCDRFADASVAYQGCGRRLGVKLVERLNRMATGGLKPDLTFLLDCPTGVGLKRALRRIEELKQEKEGRFEREKIQFHNRVRKGYLTLARKEPRRVKVIDTRKGEDKVFEEIQHIIDKIIGVKESRVQGFKLKISEQNRS